MAKENPGFEWWAALGIDVLGQNPLGMLKTLIKLPKYIKAPEPDGGLMELDEKCFKFINKNLKLVWEPLPIEPDLKLWDIYVTPDAKFKKNKKSDEVKVKDLLFNLRKTIVRSNLPIIVHGEPGHGKTSTMRMLAQVHALDPQDRTDTILLYEMKHLGDLNASLFEILRRETPFLEDESFFQGRNTVLIIDGLDERQITDGSDKFLGSFISNLFRLNRNVNGESTRLNLLFTGRTLFVDQIKSYFGEEFHLFRIMNFDDSQTDLWLEKYNKLKEGDINLSREKLKAKQLGELINQPILLTIVSRILSDPLGIEMLEEISPKEISRGLIYELICRWTIQKKYSFDQSPLKKDEENNHYRFLKIVAYLKFRLGGRPINVESLKMFLREKEDVFQVQEFLDAGQLSVGGKLENLAVGFFFKGERDGAFDFIHKSVWDHLTLEAVIMLLDESLKDFDMNRKSYACKKIAEDLYFILGKNRLLKWDHLPFLFDWSRERRWEGFTEKLCVFFEMASNHQFLIKNEGGQHENPLVTEENLLGNLLWLIFGQIKETIRLQGLNSVIWFLIGQRFNSIFLPYADLSGASLGLAHLNEADLSGANLNRANLSGASLNRAHLNEADLSGANLNRASLNQASLAMADLSGADLRWANLSETNLSMAGLSRADLSGANLIEASLVQASLAMADLSGASLGLAHLNEADLSGAILNRANLRGANLVQASLRGADLSGAHLSRAGLIGADLSGASLSNIKEWKSITDYSHANIFLVKDPPTGFREWALENGAVDMSLAKYMEYLKILKENFFSNPDLPEPNVSIANHTNP